VSTTGIPSAFFGAALVQSDRGSRSNVRPPGETLEARKRSVAPAPANDRAEQSPPEPVIDGKWAPWKVTTLVLLFCGAFWGAAIWLAGTVFHVFH
jgi:hypothetical protein